LNAVEVNYTFRRSLSEKAADSWVKDVGPDFRFSLKANQHTVALLCAPVQH